MIPTFVVFTLLVVGHGAGAASCGPELDAYVLSPAEVTSAGKYWHVADRLHLAWTEGPERRYGVSLSWDAVANPARVEKFLRAITLPSTVVDAVFHAGGTKRKIPNLNIGWFARRWRAVERRRAAGGPLRLVRYDAHDENLGPLTIWAATPDTEESLGIEVRTSALRTNALFVRELMLLIADTMHPRTTPDDAAKLVNALVSGLKREIP